MMSAPLHHRRNKSIGGTKRADELSRVFSRRSTVGLASRVHALSALNVNV